MRAVNCIGEGASDLIAKTTRSENEPFAQPTEHARAMTDPNNVPLSVALASMFARSERDRVCLNEVDI
jgi:hypothetical protein